MLSRVTKQKMAELEPEFCEGHVRLNTQVVGLSRVYEFQNKKQNEVDEIFPQFSPDFTIMFVVNWPWIINGTIC